MKMDRRVRTDSASEQWGTIEGFLSTRFLHYKDHFDSELRDWE